MPGVPNPRGHRLVLVCRLVGAGPTAEGERRAGGSQGSLICIYSRSSSSHHRLSSTLSISGPSSTLCHTTA